jgi:formate dehydrogenase iron-sulfur subunit
MTGGGALAQRSSRGRDGTAVDRFAALHDSGGLSPTVRLYRDRLPLSAPGPGEQYAFEVDLDACSGCKACVTACHALNGLDEGETWRRVGLLVGTRGETPILQHVTAACHHCVDPACLAGCPAEAYEKDPSTGIVHHLDDLCIGCRYCTFTCPYDVPLYNARLGIVRKCDLCSGRLATREAPACVQACPNGAIRVTLVGVAEAVARAEKGDFVPASADPRITRPTTIYRSRRPLPAEVRVGDCDLLAPEPSHWPLAAMLVLTQLSVGVFAAGRILEWRDPSFGAISRLHAATAAAVGLLALGASVFHLGRPLLAWRAILGLRHSWLSREIAAFGLFAVLAGWFALGEPIGVAAKSSRLAAVSTVTAGIAGLLCSAMIYAVAGRPSWRAPVVVAKFFGTAVVLGCAGTLLSAAVGSALGSGVPIEGLGRSIGAVLAAASAAKLLLEAAIFLRLREGLSTPLGRTARLLADVLYPITAARFAVGWVGGVAIPLLVLVSGPAAGRVAGGAIVVSFGFVLLGELLERHLFFRAATAPRMPGGASP